MTRTLINLREFPPGGYVYREVSISFPPKGYTGFLQGLDHVARDLQMARVQNPAAGLNPSLEACIEDIKAFTAHRLNYDPKWCGPAPEALDPKGNPTGKRAVRCATCGRKR